MHTYIPALPAVRVSASADSDFVESVNLQVNNLGISIYIEQWFLYF